MRNQKGYDRDVRIAAEWLCNGVEVTDQGDFDREIYILASTISVDYSVSYLTALNDIQGAINEDNGR
jgi:hypothetical protein